MEAPPHAQNHSRDPERLRGDLKNNPLANILHVLPPITFLVLAGLGTSLDPGIVFEPPLLLPLLNTVLLSAVPFAIAFLSARAYAAQGSRAFLWLGCGMVAFGLGSLLAWIGRASQYAGGACFIAALVAASRDARVRGASLPACLNELFRLSLEREVGVRTRELVDLKSIYHHSPIMMCTLDRDRRVLYANQAFTDFTGVPEEELRLDRTCGVFGCINARDDERGCGFGPRCEECRIRLAIEDTLATGAAHQNVEYAATLEHAGARRDVVLPGSTVLIPGPHQPHLLLTFLDITDRRRVAERLRRSEEAYRKLIDSTSEGFSIVQDGRIVFANRALAEICGYPVPELLRLGAEQVAAIVHPDDRARVLGNMARRLAGEEAPAAQIIRFLHRDGSERCVETHSVRIEYEGRPAIQVGYRDITVQRAAEDDLQLTHQKMRNLATHLLHAREEERKTAVQVTESRIGGNSATAMYRIVQEALTNISRHANASRVSLLLSEADEHLEVLVKDDGIGISETQTMDVRSFGLIGIRERVQGLGGEVSIRGETGKGTTVAVSIPHPGGGNLA